MAVDLAIKIQPLSDYKTKGFDSLENVFDEIRSRVSMQGEEIKIGGFGTFDIVTDLRGERIPVFKAGRALKKVVNTLDKGESDVWRNRKNHN